MGEVVTKPEQRLRKDRPTAEQQILIRVNVQNPNRGTEAVPETVVEAAVAVLERVVEAIGREDAAGMIDLGMIEEIETRMSAAGTIAEIGTRMSAVETIVEIATKTTRIATTGEIAIGDAIGDVETPGIATTADEVTTTDGPAMTVQTTEMTIAETKFAMMPEMITVEMNGQIMAMAVATGIGIEAGIETGIGSREKSGTHVFLLTNQHT